MTLLIIGPIMNLVSSTLSTAVLGIFNMSPIIGGVLFGAFWQLMVLLGLHAAFIPVLINNLITLGSDPINAILGLTVWALAGVLLGYALKVKDKEQKSLGFGNLASCLCGVTEPTIYSIVIPNFKIFSAAWIGGGVVEASWQHWAARCMGSQGMVCSVSRLCTNPGRFGHQLLRFHRLCSIGISSIRRNRLFSCPGWRITKRKPIIMRAVSLC